VGAAHHIAHDKDSIDLGLQQDRSVRSSKVCLSRLISSPAVREHWSTWSACTRGPRRSLLAAAVAEQARSGANKIVELTGKDLRTRT